MPTKSLGCCAVLMLLLFVGGVMNLVWIAGLTLLVAIEKLAPFVRQFTNTLGNGRWFDNYICGLLPPSVGPVNPQGCLP